MSTVGENINEVERITCEKVGCRYSVGLSSGTAALHMAVKLAGRKYTECRIWDMEQWKIKQCSVLI